MSPAFKKEGPVASTSSRSVQRKAKKSSEERERSQEQLRQGKRKIWLAQTLPTRVQEPQIEAFSHGKCIKYGQSSNGIHSQGAGKDKKDFYMQIMDKRKHINSSIDVQLAKLDNKLKKLTSDINYLKSDDITFTECCKVTNARLESLSSTFEIV
ncbi:hypothetical protein O181_055635 [Austropuccinia psidii MF-1]|uniref:Uncharacterized protein n=1 Tax=Austropuccinia psidii MF-1 TaxID=1389203 RepID=A0A9Q3HVE9_9BASI|nr:hypothetical protein [Austropuccinia psidii MF-1]